MVSCWKGCLAVIRRQEAVMLLKHYSAEEWAKSHSHIFFFWSYCLEACSLSPFFAGLNVFALPLKDALGRSHLRWNGGEHTWDEIDYHKLTVCSPGPSETQMETAKGRWNQGTLEVPYCKIMEEVLVRNVDRIKTKIPAVFIFVSWAFIVNDDDVVPQKFIFSEKKNKLLLTGRETD